MRKLADWLFSINPVLIGMLSIIVYLILETTALLYAVLPPFVTAVWFRWTLAAFLSISFHLTVLNISVNSEIINRGFAVVVAGMAIVLTMFFFQVFDQTGIARFQAVTFAAIVGFCGYSYVFLFVEKYKRMLNAERLNDQIARLNRQAESDRGKLTEFSERIAELESENRGLKDQISNQLTGNLPAAATTVDRQGPVNDPGGEPLILGVRSANGRSAPKDTNGRRVPVVRNPGGHDQGGQSASLPCDVCARTFKDRKSQTNKKYYCAKNPEKCKRASTDQTLAL